MSAGHLHRRLLSVAGSQSFVGLAYGLGATAQVDLQGMTGLEASERIRRAINEMKGIQ